MPTITSLISMHMTRTTQFLHGLLAAPALPARTAAAAFRGTAAAAPAGTWLDRAGAGAAALCGRAALASARAAVLLLIAPGFVADGARGA